MPERDASSATDIGALADGRRLLRVVCEAQPVELDGAKWMHVLPAGPFVEAKDGRTFQVSDLLSIAAHCAVPCLVDLEHRSEWGGSTEAAGWVEEFAVEDGSSKRFPRPGIWGRCAYTVKGAELVTKGPNGEPPVYRFVSPVLLIDERTRDVTEICSVALTNRPALSMHALDAYREQLSARIGAAGRGEKYMLTKERFAVLCGLLGLAPEASEEAFTEAFKAKTGGDAATKELCAKLTRDVAEKDAEIGKLRKQVTDHEAQAFKSEVSAALDNAAREGRLTPASRAGHEAFCMRGREFFESFRDNVLPHLPVIGEPAPASKPGATGAAKSDDAIVAHMERQGYSKEQISAALAMRDQRAKSHPALAAEED